MVGIEGTVIAMSDCQPRIPLRNNVVLYGTTPCSTDNTNRNTSELPCTLLPWLSANQGCVCCWFSVGFCYIPHGGKISREKMFVKVLKLAQMEMFVVISCLQLNGKPCPYTMVVPDKMIEALEGRPGNALEKKPKVAITALFSNERFPLCVYKVAVCIHPFPQHVKSQKWPTDEWVNFMRLRTVQLQDVSSYLGPLLLSVPSLLLN